MLRLLRANESILLTRLLTYLGVFSVLFAAGRPKCPDRLQSTLLCCLWGSITGTAARQRTV